MTLSPNDMTILKVLKLEAVIDDRLMAHSYKTANNAIIIKTGDVGLSANEEITLKNRYLQAGWSMVELTSEKGWMEITLRRKYDE